MKIRRTDDPNVCYMEADPDWQAYGVAAFRIDTKDRKFLLTPVGRNGSSRGPTADITDMHEKFLREQP